MIEICYATDEKYCRYMATSMLSVLLSADGNDAIRFWILDNGMTDESRNWVRGICWRYGAEVEFCRVAAERFASFPAGGPHISNTTYARYDIAELVSDEVGRILYLDCDTLVKASLRPLYDCEIGGCVLGGVEDLGYWMGRQNHPDEYPMQGFYINAGVLLIDLAAWRRCGMGARLLDYTGRHAAELKIGDQDVINAVCRGRIFRLDSRYNVQDSFVRFSCNQYPDKAFGDEIEIATLNPTVIHYTFRNKPWNTAHLKWGKDWLTVYRKLPGLSDEAHRQVLALYDEPWLRRISDRLEMMRLSASALLLPWRRAHYQAKIRRRDWR